MKTRIWPLRLFVPFLSIFPLCCLCGAVDSGGGSSGPKVESVESGVVVSVGVLRFELSTDSRATLRWVEIEGKRIVNDNREPLLAARLMESVGYDGRLDFVAERTFVDGRYEVTGVDHSVDGGRFSAMITGALSFGRGDRFPFQIALSAEVAQPHIGINVKLDAEGDFLGRAVRDVVLQMPLALDWRKRVAQGGDQGLEWDTRYYYEFPGRSGILPAPDRNEFRYFGVEQDSPHHFRIWRAESSVTPEMTHQHGLEAAGWTSVYDRSGGVLFAYRGMAAAAPKTLEVYAPGEGEARVWIYPESAPALLLANKSLAAAVFGRWHETDWIFYSGEHPDAGPDELLADLWGKPHPLIGSRPERGGADLWDAGLDLWGAPSVLGDDAPYVSGGIPIPRSSMQPGDPVVLTGPGGEYPCQTQVLAYWPDGSVKWLHLVFAFDSAVPTAGAGGVKSGSESESFVVTLRNDEDREFTLYYGGQLEPVVGANLVAVSGLSVDTQGNPQSVRVDTGPLQAVVSTGAYWLAEAIVHGREAWRADSQGPEAFVDFVRPQEAYRARSTHPAGTPDPGAVIIDSLSVEESGPLRSVIRLQGRAMCEEPADVIMRLEFFAGRPWIRITHSVEFNQWDPRVVFMTGMGIRFPLGVEASNAVVTVGGQDGAVTVEPDDYAGVLQLSHMHFQVREDSGGVLKTAIEDHRSRGWIDVSDSDGGLTVALRNMWQEYPKELSWSAAAGDLTAWLWPKSHRVMDVRRYSNFPHSSQGESIGGGLNNWVEERYYGTEDAPGDAFVGTSRSHELMLFFHPSEPDAIGIAESVVADFQSPPLIYSGYDTYRAMGITVPLPDMEKFPHIAANLDNYTDFWLFHQRYWGWFGMWDYADVQHRFGGGGYGWKVEPEALLRYIETPAEGRSSFRDYGELILDYRPQQDWLFDNGRWGWTNTEGLPGLYFQQEYLRTGRRDVFFMAEALGRHARDVVTRQSGRFFGSGTRHGVQHWSDGNHEERQATVVEYRHHYYLTGDPRSRDVVMKLSDHYRTGRVRRAHHSGRIPALFMRWEMTNEGDVGEFLREYLHTMVLPEGFSGYADLTLRGDSITANDLEIGLHARSMFFHNFGALHGVIEYCMATGDAAVIDALVKSNRAAFESGGPLQKGSTYYGLLAGFAAHHDPDPGWIKELITAEMEDPGTTSRDAFAMVSWNPRHWTGETAYLSRQSPLCWFYTVSLPVVLSAIDSEPNPPRRVWQRLAEAAEAERPERDRRPFRPRVSWQDEYDDPALEEYFAPWRPRPTN